MLCDIPTIASRGIVARRARTDAAAPGVLARYSWDTAAAQTLAGIEGIVRK